MPASAPHCGTSRHLVAILAFAAITSMALHRASAATVILNDGRILRGDLVPLPSLTQNAPGPPESGAPAPKIILMIDDGLRRYFIPQRRVREVGESTGPEVPETFRLWQPVKQQGLRVQTVGSILKIGPFDEFGRRTFTMNTDRGPLDIIQGITEITPNHVKVEGLSHVWDQRIATSSIPREQLEAILAKVTDDDKVEHRLKVARLYLQSRRYAEAQRELESIVSDFPDVQARVTPALDRLRQLAAQQLLDELRLRQGAGQHALFSQLLSQFPSEGIAGETLQEVRELLDQFRTLIRRREALIAHLEEDLAALADSDTRARLTAAIEEIAAELSFETLNRLTPYEQLRAEKQLAAEQGLALALSGWLAGPGAATENLAVATAMFETRNRIRAYLVEPIQLERERLLAEMHSSEAGIPQTVDRLVRHMKPPWPIEESLPGRPGMFYFEVAGHDDQPDFGYFIQLPPEYDPYRRYPTIVTLHGAFSTPETQIDWWAGQAAEEGPSAGQRQGQATRHGYIVVAPAWARPKQSRYGYSAAEHMAVLNSLRDACRRFAIDTDRVYLTGHSMGGDAAWDLGLAHPDLWAGVIPIAAQADRYCSLYWENGKYVPFYVVSGELDSDKAAKNLGDLNRYFRYGHNITFAEFRGRGHEHFSDEILALFDWMGRYRRDFFPREFSCKTLRPWDNFFWWVEIGDIPSRNIVLPDKWPPQRGTRPMLVTASVSAANNLRARTGAQRVTLWLTPELLGTNLDSPVDVNINGARLRGLRTMIEADIEVLLEDVRTRGDRQHPFWARVDYPSS